MKPISISPEEVMNLLAENRERIAALVDGIEADVLRAKPDPDAWSVNDALAHLRSCADVWGGCIARILAEDHPTIRAVNPRLWIKSTGYPELDFHPSFEAFGKQRTELLTCLASLKEGDWERGATITGAGAPLERSVRMYAAWLARHEQTHLGQIGRILVTLRD